MTSTSSPLLKTDFLRLDFISFVVAAEYNAPREHMTLGSTTSNSSDPVRFPFGFYGRALWGACRKRESNSHNERFADSLSRSPLPPSSSSSATATVSATIATRVVSLPHKSTSPRSSSSSRRSRLIVLGTIKSLLLHYPLLHKSTALLFRLSPRRKPQGLRLMSAEGVVAPRSSHDDLSSARYTRPMMSRCSTIIGR